MQKSVCVVFLWLLISSTVSFAQTDDETIRVETQLIDVPIVVNDKTGKPILNLKKSNFVVFEDGKPQEIAEFSATSAPFEVALLLDTSGSTRADLALIQRAAANFVESLRPGDRVSIIAYRTERTETTAFSVSEVLTGLTADRKTLERALEAVKTSNSTPFYDSLLQVANIVFRDVPKDEFRGRRALVALTDGVDSASAAEFDEVRSELEKAGIISFFVEIDTRDSFEENLMGNCAVATRFSTAQIRRFYRTYYPKIRIEKTYDFCKLGDFERLEISKGLYELAGKQLDELAKRSGGKVFPAVDLAEARAAFKSVAGEIGTKYSLGYYSTNEKRDGTYRKITVELKGVPAGATVRTREGYRAIK
ncbi:MAG: VWA domain-containing protein [Acidobacteria bacterium]|nr:VWA domain-containing protein [Acidobacteriota bacterium]